ncbi:MAG: hypothetical protein AVDCRST_MAG16-146, partial [uncultured Frankineae bacterium]
EVAARTARRAVRHHAAVGGTAARLAAARTPLPGRGRDDARRPGPAGGRRRLVRGARHAGGRPAGAGLLPARRAVDGRAARARGVLPTAVRLDRRARAGPVLRRAADAARAAAAGQPDDAAPTAVLPAAGRGVATAARLRRLVVPGADRGPAAAQRAAAAAAARARRRGRPPARRRRPRRDGGGPAPARRPAAGPRGRQRQQRRPAHAARRRRGRTPDRRRPRGRHAPDRRGPRRPARSGAAHQGPRGGSAGLGRDGVRPGRARTVARRTTAGDHVRGARRRAGAGRRRLVVGRQPRALRHGPAAGPAGVRPARHRPRSDRVHAGRARAPDRQHLGQLRLAGGAGARGRARRRRAGRGARAGAGAEPPAGRAVGAPRLRRGTGRVLPAGRRRLPAVAQELPARRLLRRAAGPLPVLLRRGAGRAGRDRAGPGAAPAPAAAGRAGRRPRPAARRRAHRAARLLVARRRGAAAGAGGAVGLGALPPAGDGARRARRLGRRRPAGRAARTAQPRGRRPGRPSARARRRAGADRDERL